MSTVEQAEKGASLDAQLGEARAYARVKRLQIAREYVERGASATDESHRPVFRQMINDLLAPENTAGIVIVVHTSRFMRDAAKARIHKVALQRNGVRVVSVQQPLPENDDFGWYVEAIFELNDQLESLQNSKRTRAGMAQTARNGYWPGSRAPFGFRIEKVSGPGGAPKSKLVVAPDEASLVHHVLALYIARKGAVAVASELNAAGCCYRGHLWDRDLVLRVVSDPIAIGEARWGRRDSRTGRTRSEDEHVLVPVEPIVDRSLFELAQAERARRDPERNPGRSGSTPLLLGGGILKCGKCGASYQLQSAGKRRADGSRYAYYQCSRARRSGIAAGCAGYPFPVELLDAAIINHLATAVFGEARCGSILADLIETSGALRHRAAAERSRWETERADLLRRRARLVDAIETGSLLSSVIADRMSEIDTKLTGVNTMLAKVAELHQDRPGVHEPATIRRFQHRILAALHADRLLVGVYLRALVTAIIVESQDTVRVEPKASIATSAVAGQQVRVVGYCSPITS